MAFTYAYIGTVYSKHPRGHHAAFVEASVLAAELVSHDIPVFCPIAHSHPLLLHGTIDPVDHDLWMRVDEPFLRTESLLIVATMDGWKESRGLQAEIDHFLMTGKPIAYINPASPDIPRLRALISCLSDDF